MTLTFELDLNSVGVNYCAKYLGQMSFRSKVVVGTHTDTQTHTHTGPIALSGPLKWSVTIFS